MSKAPPIKIRPVRPEDLLFIYNSWLKSYRNSRVTKEWTNAAYYAAQKETIDALIPIARIEVAVSTEDDNHILGYIVGNCDCVPRLIHFLYVKQSYRKLGIATALLAHLLGKDWRWASLGDEGAVYTSHWKPHCKRLGLRNYENYLRKIR